MRTTRIDKWMDKESVFRGITNYEVVVTHIVLILGILACGLAEWID